ncbi:hypothetical protein [Halovulum sp. GXIMD14793]
MRAFLKSVLTVALCLSAAPAISQQLSAAFPVPLACVDQSVGSEGCALAAVAEGFDRISPGYFNIFREAKLESFYMSHVTNQFTGPLNAALSGDKCSGIEAVYFFGETSFIYLPPAEDIPASVREEYLRWQAVMDNVSVFLDSQATGGC